MNFLIRKGQKRGERRHQRDTFLMLKVEDDMENEALELEADR